MYLLLFVAYIVAEIAVLAWLGSAIGAGATVLVFLAVSVAGYLTLGALGRRALRDLSTLRQGRVPSTATAETLLTDGALIGAGAALVLVPGLLTSVVGIVLLAPTRAAVRPVARRLAARRAGRGGMRAQRLVVVDGQVVSHTVVGADPVLTGTRPVPDPGGRTVRDDHRHTVIDTGGHTVVDTEIVDTPSGRDDR